MSKHSRAVRKANKERKTSKNQQKKLQIAKKRSAGNDQFSRKN